MYKFSLSNFSLCPLDSKYTQRWLKTNKQKTCHWRATYPSHPSLTNLKATFPLSSLRAEMYVSDFLFGLGSLFGWLVWFDLVLIFWNRFHCVLELIFPSRVTMLASNSQNSAYFSLPSAGFCLLFVLERHTIMRNKWNFSRHPDVSKCLWIKGMSSTVQALNH